MHYAHGQAVCGAEFGEVRKSPFYRSEFICFSISQSLLPVKIKITSVAATTYCALPSEGDAAHIPVDTVIAQAEGSRQLFTPEQFAILHIGARENIRPCNACCRIRFPQIGSLPLR